MTDAHDPHDGDETGRAALALADTLLAQLALLQATGDSLPAAVQRLQPLVPPPLAERLAAADRRFREGGNDGAALAALVDDPALATEWWPRIGDDQRTRAMAVPLLRLLLPDRLPVVTDPAPATARLLRRMVIGVHCGHSLSLSFLVASAGVRAAPLAGALRAAFEQYQREGGGLGPALLGQAPTIPAICGLVVGRIDASRPVSSDLLGRLAEHLASTPSEHLASTPSEHLASTPSEHLGHLPPTAN